MKNDYNFLMVTKTEVQRVNQKCHFFNEGSLKIMSTSSMI